MPYDPDLYPDEDPIDNFNYDPKDDYDELGDDYDPDLDPNHQGDYDEDVDEFYDAEGVEDEPPLQAPADVPQHPRRATLSPLKPSRSERHATPTSASVRDGTPRSVRVAVVLPATVKKEAYISVPDVASDEEEEDTLVGNIVTSDLMPPTPKRRKITERSSTKPSPAAAAANYVPPKVQPPPFPVPDIPAPAPLVNPPKKRGRPVGWRPGLSYAAMRGNPVPPPRPKVPKPPKAPGEVKRRGRPPKKPHELPREIFSKLTPRYIRFLCEWEGCPAELHNFETLRKHVLIVHGDYKQPRQHHPGLAKEQQEPKTCKWASCQSKRLQSKLPPLALPTKTHFEAHVDECHLIPFLWHVGDGPRNTSIESPLSEKPLTITSALPPPPSSSSITSHHADTTTTKTPVIVKPQPLPPYLFDASGNQVTPSVRDQLYENDDDKRRRRARLERVHFLRDENAAPEPVYTQAERDAMEASLAAKKKKQDEFWEYYDKVMGPVVEVTVPADPDADPENPSGNPGKEVKRKMLSCGWDPTWRGLYQD